MIKECSVCGEEFECQKSTALYCSDACRNAARREREHKKKELGISQGTLEKTCLLCGKNFFPKTAAANKRSCCYECMPDGHQLTRGESLAKIKINHGGKCVKCGYNKCIKALEFHHLDSSQKDFTISNDRFKLEEAINEAKKCILLCANCHREFHDGLWEIEELNLNNKE